MLQLDAFRRKPRNFNYRPVYFDPAKEARQERRRELFGEEAFDEQASTEGYKAGSYIREHGFYKNKTKPANSSLSAEKISRNIRRGVIALILLFTAAAYLIFG